VCINDNNNINNIIINVYVLMCNNNIIIININVKVILLMCM